MSTATNATLGGKARHETRDPRWVQVLLIAVSMSFVGVLLLFPLLVVFIEAFRDGWSGYIASFKDPAAWQAIKLTLIAAGISV
jgi:sulfate transport system permease protein